jgi:putative heme utilization carrier protein HutX
MNHLHNAHWAAAATMLALGLTPALAAAAGPCAAPADQERVAKELAQSKSFDSLRLSEKLGLPEALVVSALPAGQRIAVAGTEFRAVWDSLSQWGDAQVVIRKLGNVFEIHGRIPGGEPSKRSQYFNLAENPGGVSGHLRPDLVRQIYALAVPAGDSLVRGVIFYAEDGQQTFGVFLPGEGAPPSAAAVQAFERTWAAMKTLPQLCTG